MSKRSNRFQQTPPTGQFWRDIGAVPDKSKPPRKLAAKDRTVLSRIWDGTKRVGVQHFCKNNLTDLEQKQTVVELIRLGCFTEAEVASLGLPEGWSDDVATAIWNSDREHILSLIDRGFARLKSKPTRATIIGLDY